MKIAMMYIILVKQLELPFEDASQIEHYQKNESGFNHRQGNESHLLPFRCTINPCRLIDFDNFKTKFDTLYISGYTVSVPNPTQQVEQPAKPKPQTSAQYYKVRKGDNLGRIAAKYHTTVSKIKKLNHLRSDFIREGQRLRVR